MAAIEHTLLEEHHAKRTIIYHAEHFASVVDAMRRRLGISDEMALQLREKEKTDVYSQPMPDFAGTYCFCLRNTKTIDLQGMELEEAQGVLLAELLPDSVQQIRLDGCGLGVPTARALAETVARSAQLNLVNIARDVDGFPLELEHIRADRIADGALNLSSRLLFDADVIVLLAALPAASKISSLDLSGNSLSTIAADALAGAMTRMPALRSINLSKNYIGDEGLLKLLGICGCVHEDCPLPTSLTSLNVRDNNIGGSGAAKLAEMLSSGALPSAADIDLSHNWIDTCAAKTIAHCANTFPPSLQSFSLFRNQMCDDSGTCQLFKGGKCLIEPPAKEMSTYAPPSSLVELLGKTLIRGVDSAARMVGSSRSLAGSDSAQKEIATTSLTNKVVALYFGAAWCAPCNDFTTKAKKNGWYEQLQKAEEPVEMIYISSDRDIQGFHHYYADHPWLALPFEAREVKARLSSKYNVSGIPTLVLLKNDCTLITKEGMEAIRDADFRKTGNADTFKEDDTGPNITEAILAMAEQDSTFRFLAPTDKCGGAGSLKPADVLKGLDCYGVYYSGHWCPHCPPMTAAMAPVYARAKQLNLKFEIIFISGDEDEDSYNDYRLSMPWIAFEYECKASEAIQEMLNFDGLPTMALIGKDGLLKNMKGCNTVKGDPQCENFPWNPLPVYQLKHATDEWMGKPTLLVLQESAPHNRQAETVEALRPLSESFMANVKEGFSKFDILFAVANDDEHPVVKAARKMVGCDPSDKSVCTVILVLRSRNPHFFAHGGDLTTSSIACFLQAFMAGALQKQPLRRGGR